MIKVKKIRKETERLLKLFEKIPNNKKALIKNIIENAAFITVELEELQEKINTEQNIKLYDVASKLHIQQTKNLNSLIKELSKFLPEELINDELDIFLNSREGV